MKKLIYILLFIISQFSYSYVNVYPLKFDKKIDGNGGNETFFLHNYTGKKVRYRIYAEESITDKTRDMSKWIDFYPRSITLVPGEEKEVKVFIGAPPSTPKGEYLAVLGFKQVEIPELSEDNKMLEKNNLQVFTDLKVEIAGIVGDVKSKIIGENISIRILDNGKVKLNGKVKNIGDKRGFYKIVLFNSNGKEKILLGTKRILKGRELDFSTLDYEVEDEIMKKKLKKINSLGIVSDENGVGDSLTVKISK